MTQHYQARSTRIGKWFDVHPLPAWAHIGIRTLFAFVVFKALPLDPIAIPGLGRIRPLEPAGRVLYDSQPLPVGLAHWIDFSFLSRLELQPWLWCLFGICLISYVLGRGLAVTLPLMTFVFIGSRTLENSQGFTSHAYQVIGGILLLQSIAAVVWAFRRWRKMPAANRLTLQDYLFRYAQVAIVATYVISVCSKWNNSDGRWIANSPYFGLDLVKTDRQNYYTKIPGSPPGEVPMAEQMLAHPNVSRMVMGAGLMLELGCVVALAHPALALVIGILIIVFHQSVAHFMGLYFPYNEMAVLVFLVNPVYWIGTIFLVLRQRLVSS